MKPKYITFVFMLLMVGCKSELHLEAVDPDAEKGNGKIEPNKPKNNMDEFFNNELNKIQGGENSDKGSELLDKQVEGLRSDIEKIERERDTPPNQ